MIYFDNSATTAPCEAVKRAAKELFESDSFGNPGSLHKLGVAAQKQYAQSRENIAKNLGCNPSELYFTSCATESANTAIFGYLSHNKRAGKTIVSTKTEHRATLSCLEKLESEGCKVVYLPVDKTGRPTEEAVSNALSDGDCALLCLTYVNNETGARLPEDLYAKARQGKTAALYVDFVQALGKVKFDLKLCDMASFSAHKVHGPKGVGALYVNSKTRIDPYILGGGQQGGMRSGTENPFGAKLFETAINEAYENMDAAFENISAINAYLRDELTKRGCTILSPDDALPYVLNVSFPDFESETMLHCLEMYDIYVSTVSACSSKAKKVSYVLLETGVDRKLAANAVRLSFSRYNTMEEAKKFIESVDDIYEKFCVKR